MEWQTPVAIALSALAGAYALRQWTRPLFAAKTEADQASDELLQIETPEN